MSLRAKIVLSVLLVNVAVTIVLMAFFLVEVRDAETERESIESRQNAQRVQTLKRMFGHLLAEDSLFLEVDRIRGVEPGEIMKRLWEHSVKNWIEDGVVVDRNYQTQPRQEDSGDVDVEVWPTQVFLNLRGAKDRSPDFDVQFALRKIDEARAMRHAIEGPDWVAAPIRLKNVMEGVESVDSSSESWGGGFFKLKPDDPLPVWNPRYTTSLFWVMGLGTLLLVGLTLILLHRWVVRPIEALSLGAERVAERRYDEPVQGVDGSDEMARLVDTFNSMMAQVDKAERDLNSRVEDATRRAEESRRGLVIAQRLAATGTLASGIAHEINNPLGGLLNAASRLQREVERQSGNPEVQAKYLALIDDGLRRIREIVRRVLTFSPRQVEPTEASVMHIVQQAVALADHRAKKVGVDLRIDEGSQDATVLVVPGELQQVVLNLLLNACDAMEEQSGAVHVKLARENGAVEIRVQDDGVGLTAEEKERVFDLFYSTKDVGKGTGLGLSVAHHIVEQHSGRLTVESQPGQGATFIVRLPVAIPSA